MKKAKVFYVHSKSGEDKLVNELKGAVSIVKNGGIVVFPTETVYGIGADAFNTEAVKKIFVSKNRPIDNPLIVHIADFDIIDKITCNVDPNVLDMIKSVFPAPCSVVVKKSSAIPDIVSACLDTVAIRMPQNIVARKFIELSGVPIAAPSANISTKPSGTRSWHILEELGDKVDGIIIDVDSEPNIGIESTVIDTTTDTWKILRSGKMGIDDFLKYMTCNNKIVKENNQVLKKTPKSPGIKYKHYSPKASIRIFDKSFDKTQVDNLVCRLEKLGKKIFLIDYDTSEEFALNLFNDFRKADDLGTDIILIREVIGDALANAVMDRVYKASEGEKTYEDIIR